MQLCFHNLFFSGLAFFFFVDSSKSGTDCFYLTYRETKARLPSIELDICKACGKFKNSILILSSSNLIEAKFKITWERKTHKHVHAV